MLEVQSEILRINEPGIAHFLDTEENSKITVIVSKRDVYSSSGE